MTTLTSRPRSLHSEPRTAHPRSAAEPAAPTSGSSGRRFQTIMQRLNNNAALDYFMIRLLVFFIVGVGVVMVFSSSMTYSLTTEGNTAFTEASRHALMVGLGLLVFWVALKFPLGWVRRASWLLLFITGALLIAVLTPLGVGGAEVGSQSWLPLGPIQVQPSEIAKISIAIWGASYLAGRHQECVAWRSRYTVYMVISGLFFGLIVAQGDLGMALSFAAVVAFMLFFAGAKMGIFVAGAAVAAVVGAYTVINASYRSERFSTYRDALFGNFEDTSGAAYQAHQGFLSLADGSIWGVGLGQSRAKWFYLPEAKNDFIFAVIGEELGLWGGALVIILFMFLGIFGLRTALRAQNQFQALLAASLTAGVVSQAFINIGYVVGLLPVTGIQLPMISAGGTSTIITLGAMGLLASVARHEPQAVSAMQNYGRPFFDRFLWIGEPGIEADELIDAHRRVSGKKRREAAPSRDEERYGRAVTGGRVPRRMSREEADQQAGSRVTSARSGTYSGRYTRARGDFGASRVSRVSPVSSARSATSLRSRRYE